MLSRSRSSSSRVAGVVVVEAALLLLLHAAMLVRPYAAECSGLTTKATGSSRRLCRRRAATASPSLTLAPLSLLRLKIGGSFDGHASNTAASAAAPSSSAPSPLAKRPQRPPQKSTQARQSPLRSSIASKGATARRRRRRSVLLLLLPATDEIRPTTGTQPTAKSS